MSPLLRGVMLLLLTLIYYFKIDLLLAGVLLAFYGYEYFYEYYNHSTVCEISITEQKKREILTIIRW